MSTVNEILKRKDGQAILSTRPDATVLAATQHMNEHSVGALLVLEGTELVGIFTERDVLRRVVAEERPPARVLVREVMTVDVACTTPVAPIDDAREVMRKSRIRHLPVVNADGSVLGLISIGDLNAYYSTNQEVTIHYLNEYLHGRT